MPVADGAGVVQTVAFRRCPKARQRAEGEQQMSGTVAQPGGRGLGVAHIASRWGWFVALGIALIVIGVLALFDTVAVTLISAIFIGAALLVGGVVQIVHAFMTKGWQHFLLNLLAGALYVVGGFLIMMEPVQGAFVLTLFIVAAMIAAGIFRIVIALGHREMRGWWVLALGGLVSFVVGILLLAMLPWSSLIVLGVLVAVELIVHGATWLQFGLLLRERHRSPA
jgi:uncharacterized membrane protein HdeD (DUF308 family)